MKSSTKTASVVTLILIVAALWLGRAVFIPLFMAAFFAFLLSPLVGALERYVRLPTGLAVTLSVLLGAATLGGVSYVVAVQVLDVVEELPSYRANFSQKMGAVKQVRTTIENVTQDIQDIKEGVAGEEDEAAPDPTDASTTAPPVSVKIVEKPASKFQVLLQDYLTPLARFLVSFAIVFVIVPFLLLARKSLRDRLIRLLRYENVYLTARAVDEATERVSSYLVTTVIVNLAYGVPVGIGLHLIGLPNAFLWGLFATLLRFIPYVGPWTAALMPIALSVAVFPGWTRVWYVVGLIVTLEAICSNFLEPWLYGKRTGLSTLSVLVAALFWSWLWGPAGLLLAVPITLCLSVVGRYVPRLGYLHVLLSQSDAAEPHTPLFQRLAVHDVDGAAKLARDHFESSGWISLVDQVFVPTLRLVEQERADGVLEEERAAFVLTHLAEIAESLRQECAAEVTSRAIPVCVVPGDTDSDVDCKHASVVRTALMALGFEAHEDAATHAHAERVVTTKQRQDLHDAGKDDTAAGAVSPGVYCCRRATYDEERPAECESSFADLLARLRAVGNTSGGTQFAIPPAV